MKFVFAVVSLFLFSCSQPPETRYFTLDFPRIEKGPDQSANTLIFKKIDSSSLYFEDKFIYRPSRFEVKFDPYKRWVQPPPQLLQLRAVEFFENSQAFNFVSTQLKKNEPHLMLSCTLLSFDELVLDTGREFSVGISYELYQNPQITLLVNGNIFKSVSILNKNAESIVDAASQATFMVLEELQKEILNR